MKKKVLLSLLLCLCIFSLLACSKGNDKTKMNEQKSTEQKSDDSTKKENYKKYENLGLEFKLESEWKRLDDNIGRDGIGDPEDPKEPIYDGLVYSFLANEQLKEYDAAKNIADAAEKSKKIDEIFSKQKSLCSLVIFRKELMPAEEKIKELTKCTKNEKLGEVDKYIFYFCYNNYDDSNLSDEAKKDYKLLYDDIQNVKKSIKISKPITPQEAMTTLGKVNFQLKDLKGKEYSSGDVFKENKLTMINIWATFCGPCKKELPDLEKLFEQEKSQNVGLIGIIGDTPDPDNEAAAVKIIEVKGVKYLNLIPDEKFKNQVLKSIAGYPTTIFVDSNGKIVGKVITGERSKEDYSKAIEEALNSMKK